MDHRIGSPHLHPILPFHRNKDIESDIWQDCTLNAATFCHVSPAPISPEPPTQNVIPRLLTAAYISPEADTAQTDLGMFDASLTISGPRPTCNGILPKSHRADALTGAVAHDNAGCAKWLLNLNPIPTSHNQPPSLGHGPGPDCRDDARSVPGSFRGM